MTFFPTNFGDNAFGDYLFGGMFVGEGANVPALPNYNWEILVRNPDLSIEGILGDGVRAGVAAAKGRDSLLSFEGHPKHLGLGTWLAEVSWNGDPGSPAGKLLVPGAGIVVAVNSNVVMSGPAAKFLQTRDGDKRTISVGGVDDLQCIFDREAHPQPGTAAPPYNVQTQDVRGPDPAETVIKEYVNVNAGPGAVVARRVPGLIIEADTATGSSVKGAASWQQLSELVLQLALAGGVGVRVVQTSTPQLQFQVYVPADRTNTVVFGVELGNTAGYSYGTERPAANYLYGLGSGTGTLRTIREGADATSVSDWGRIEGIADQGTSGDATILDQAITAELASKAAKFSAGILAVDTGAHQWEPVKSNAAVAAYNVGDNIGVLIEGVKITQTITELGFLFNHEGTRISPVVGTPNFGNPARGLVQALVDRIRQQDAQLRDLQRRGGD